MSFEPVPTHFYEYPFFKEENAKALQALNGAGARAGGVTGGPFSGPKWRGIHRLDWQSPSPAVVVWRRRLPENGWGCKAGVLAIRQALRPRKAPKGEGQAGEDAGLRGNPSGASTHALWAENSWAAWRTACWPRKPEPSSVYYDWGWMFGIRPRVATRFAGRKTPLAP